MTFQNLELMVAIWETEVSYALGKKYVVMRTNCTVTVRMCFPRRDTCPTNTKQCLLKRFAK